MELKDRLVELAGSFDVPLEVNEVIPLKGGHINSTYRLKNLLPNQPDVLLQKINQQVFSNVELLMQNLVSVTHHIQNQKKFEDLVPAIIPTKVGTYWLEAEDEIWRMQEFIGAKKAFEKAESAEICRKAGFTFGSFLKAVESVSVTDIKTHIPDFHNIRFRLRQLEEALQDADAKRLKKSKSSLIEMDRYRDEMCALFDEAETGKLPLRILHNDTKLSNVLIGESEMGTVIDLDTIMPGYVFFDTGDALRSIAVNTTEDDVDLDSIKIIAEYRDAFTNGYFEAAGAILNEHEMQSISRSGAYMAYIMAVRFMSDYLSGDNYYSINYSDHNLTRAKNQLKVCSLFSMG